MLCIVLCMTVFLLLFLISPLFPYIRSLAVMKIYSAQCEKGSLPDTNGFEVFVPSGEGWYPFVMNFSDDNGFSAYTGKSDTRLTIFYNFPSFDLTKGCSRLYDTKSSYYNAFYGVYFVSSGDKEPYGFTVLQESDEREVGRIKERFILESDAVADVARFDFFCLVLGDFGLTSKDRVFFYEEVFREEEISFIGYEEWTRMECKMRVNGASHEKGAFVRSYLQYGEPAFPCDEPFAPVNMHGVVIARYFEEYDVSAFFYCMAPDRQVCLDCEEKILKQSTLNHR